MRKLTVITLAMFIIFGIAFNSIQVFAAQDGDLEDIKQQRKQIQKNLSGAELQISTIMTQIEELNNEIRRVNQEIAQNEALIGQTEKKINTTISEIGQLQKEIKELEADINKRYEVLDARMSSYQKSGGHINYLDVLFGAQSFTDFISRLTMVNKITDSDADLIEQLELDIKTVEEKKILSIEKLDELNKTKKKQEDTLAAIEKKRQQNQSRMESLEKKQVELLGLIEKLKTKDNSLASVETEVKKKIALEAKKTEQLETKAAKNNKENEGSLKHVEGKSITVTSTAYTASCDGCSGITYTGINLKANPDVKVIAVDPSVIPLGSVVYVENYGYAIAGDIGSAIKGNKIDVFLPTRAEALQWGIRKVKITIQ